MKKPRLLTRSALAQFPLPSLDEAEDKDSRGRLFAVAGSRRVPGAAWLSGVAALRALKHARQVAAQIAGVVVLKAETTFIACGSGEAWRHEGGVLDSPRPGPAMCWRAFSPACLPVSFWT